MEKQKRSFVLTLALLALSTAFLAAALLTNEPSPAPADLAVPATATPAPNPTATPGVYLGERYYPAGLHTLDLTGQNVSARALLDVLDVFPALERVEVRDCDYTAAERAALRAAAPAVVFQWPVTVLGDTYLSTQTALSFADREDVTDESLDELRAAAPEFYDLRSLDLTGCPLSGEAAAALDEALPDTAVRWTIELYGKPFASDAREIDLSGIKVGDDGAAVEAALPWFPQLEKVVMCSCGVADKDMAALNDRHEDVRFVWEVTVSRMVIRTDADYFISYKESGLKLARHSAGLSALQYCPDLIALDIGHYHTRDISYVANMRHLKYLVMVENYVLDMTPLTDLKELKWLEMFQCAAKDISPLLTCTALEDLNICYVVCNRDNLYETLRQMTWLKRLWCSGTPMTRAQIASLREELPDCEIWCNTGDESTGSTWRYSESYYEMRDAFHMYYMNIYGSRVGRLDAEGLEKMHKRFWK